MARSVLLDRIPYAGRRPGVGCMRDTTIAGLLLIAVPLALGVAIFLSGVFVTDSSTRA